MTVALFFMLWERRHLPDAFVSMITSYDVVLPPRLATRGGRNLQLSRVDFKTLMCHFTSLDISPQLECMFLPVYAGLMKISAQFILHLMAHGYLFL